MKVVNQKVIWPKIVFQIKNITNYKYYNLQFVFQIINYKYYIMLLISQCIKTLIHNGVKLK